CDKSPPESGCCCPTSAAPPRALRHTAGLGRRFRQSRSERRSRFLRNVPDPIAHAAGSVLNSSVTPPPASECGRWLAPLVPTASSERLIVSDRQPSGGST